MPISTVSRHRWVSTPHCFGFHAVDNHVRLRKLSGKALEFEVLVRNYLTTFIWYQDRLCSLSSAWLIVLSLGCVIELGGLAFALYQFLDDLAFLLFEADLRIVGIFFGLLLVISIGLWVLSCCLGALGRRAVLYLRGL